MKLSLKQIHAVRCPTCGVAPGKKCELTTGLPRGFGVGEVVAEIVRD